MTVNISQVNPASETFQNWVEKTNEVIDAVSNKVLTANTGVVPGTTVGNSFLIGNFGSSTLFADGSVDENGVVTGGLTGGNSTVVGTTLYIASNTYFGGNVFSFGPNIQILPGSATEYAAIVAYGVRYGLTSTIDYATTVGLGNTTYMDTIANAQWSAAEYSIYMKDRTPGGNAVAFTKLTLMTDDNDVYLTEYGTMVTNTSAGVNGMLGTFSTTIDKVSTPTPLAIVTLSFTPAVANCKLVWTRNGVVGLFPE